MPHDLQKTAFSSCLCMTALCCTSQLDEMHSTHRKDGRTLSDYNIQKDFKMQGPCMFWTALGTCWGFRRWTAVVSRRHSCWSQPLSFFFLLAWAIGRKDVCKCPSSGEVLLVGRSTLLNKSAGCSRFLQPRLLDRHVGKALCCPSTVPLHLPEHDSVEESTLHLVLRLRGGHCQAIEGNR